MKTHFESRPGDDATDLSEMPEPLVSVPVQRHERGQAQPWVDDQVVAEVPVALVFNGISHAVMMCTPQHLHEMALGFALSEGIIDRASDCYGIEIAAADATGFEAAGAETGAVEGMHIAALEVRLEIASSAFVRLKEKRRSLAGRSGCGLCGVDSLQALDLLPARPQPAPPWLAQVGAATIFKALAVMPAWQPLNQATGAVHAAGFADTDGTLIAVYEDVGRHNALDKLLGARAQAVGDAAWPQEGFVIMSSRASYELVRKCARLGVPLLATISAPTSLAITVAQASGLQLWGLTREPRAVRYTP